MKKTMYQVRYFEGRQYSRAVGHSGRLLDRNLATRVVRRLKSAGVEAFASKILIAQ